MRHDELSNPIEPVRRLSFSLAAVSIVIKVLVLAVLSWHIAFEAVPGIVTRLTTHGDLTGLEQTALLLRLLPYLLLIGYLTWRPRSALRGSTVALALLSVVLYVAIVFGSTLYLHRAFSPV
ncbi:hypothetical protein M8A51_13340 [Schlegelella sp. S2-27]|uniref:DUF5658 domain-containing protein n=1 Tax=Caldimonas mangrovi TaxID=2944811 RepID=A0ABT0YP40_9BURK|nr:hypothetical protein [Caldimonas mangrovi]MCM5680513.1 hypothetical protein [Caldimonas mangrovi]